MPLPYIAQLASSLGIAVGRFMVGTKFKTGGREAIMKEITKRKFKSSKGRQRQRVLNPEHKKQLMKKAARAENKANK